MTSKDLRRERAKLIEDARALLNKSRVSSDDHVSANRLIDAAEHLKARIDRLERVNSLFAELSQPINGKIQRGHRFVEDAAREQSILARIAHTGSNHALRDADKDYVANVIARDYRILGAISDESVFRLSAADQAHHATAFSPIQNAGSTSSNTGGGYTIAPLFEAQLRIALKAWGGMRQVARNIQTDTGAALPWPTMDDTGNTATILGSENTAVGTGTDLAFGQTSIGAYTYVSGAIPVSLQLMQDSAFDFGSLIENAIVTRFGRAQNAHFTFGSGAGQPSGVVTGAAVGKVGATGQTTTVTYDDVLDLEHSVDPAYRQSAAYMMHDSSLRVFKKIKDTTGRPMFVSGITSGADDTLNGYPIVINQDMPVMTPNAKSVLFGNFTNYIIRDVTGLQIQVLRERYADLLQVTWMAYLRSDGRLVSAAQPVKYYQNSAT